MSVSDVWLHSETPLLVHQIMSPAPTVPEGTGLDEVARVMLESSSPTVAVLDAEGRVVGVIVEPDFVPRQHYRPQYGLMVPRLFGEVATGVELEVIYRNVGRTMTARDVAHPIGGNLSEDDTVSEAIRQLTASEAGAVPVLRDERLVGMVTARELLRLFRRDH